MLLLHNSALTIFTILSENLFSSQKQTFWLFLDGFALALLMKIYDSYQWDRKFKLKFRNMKSFQVKLVVFVRYKAIHRQIFKNKNFNVKLTSNNYQLHGLCYYWHRIWDASIYNAVSCTGNIVTVCNFPQNIHTNQMTHIS